jgi:hypothetical protein
MLVMKWQSGLRSGQHGREWQGKNRVEAMMCESQDLTIQILSSLIVTFFLNSSNSPFLKKDKVSTVIVIKRFLRFNPA